MMNVNDYTTEELFEVLPDFLNSMSRRNAFRWLAMNGLYDGYSLDEQGDIVFHVRGCLACYDISKKSFYALF